MADDDIIYIGTVTQENARRLRPRRPIRYFEVDDDTDYRYLPRRGLL